MNKIILLFVSIVFTAVSLNAQDLYLSWEGKRLGDTVRVWGEPTAEEIDFHAVLHNNSGLGMNVMVRRMQIETIEGTSNQFYWKELFGPDVDTSTTSVFIPHGGSGTEDDFFGRYFPESNYGISRVEYVFYNKDNEDQNLKVLVEYWTSPESIAEEAMQGGSISPLYPNPAATTVNLDFDLPSSVRSAGISIFNMMGAVVRESAVYHGTNKLSMDVSGLESGIYFYTILINGDVYRTEKFIIQ
jgi:hypothetical protein